ncbi:MAG TPA: M28 family peptidase [Blastocatellia bacterium]|nr:M28 family peptidase [Blastocatellia bacterium]
MLFFSFLPRLMTLILATGLLGLTGCDNPSAANNKPTTAAPAESKADDQSLKPTEFDGQRAFESVRKQVEFGPHPAGSPAIKQVQKYIMDELKSYGLTVKTQSFKPKTPIGSVEMLNIIGELPGQSTERILIASHYDTKPFKEFRFVGANDGGSSTGTLLEIARVMAKGEKPKDTIQFVFFDGEEAFCKEWDECLNGKDHTYGSQYFADDLKKNAQVSQVKALILLDMIGDKGLQFKKQETSTPWLTNIFWSTGKRLGYDKTFNNGKDDVGGDDHMPFLQIGIPAIDLIHLPFPDTWHEPTDTLDHISAENLKIVGDTVIRAIPQIEAYQNR